MDVKRIVFLLSLALAIGLVLVQLRTLHMRAVSETVKLNNKERQLRLDIWQQQVQLSGGIESPEYIKKQIEKYQIEMKPRGAEADVE